MQEWARTRWAEQRPGHDHPVDAACVAPWVSLEFDPQGWVYTCCANQLYPLGRIGEQRLRDLWDGARQGVLRDALTRWDLSVGCASCQWHLEHGRMDPDAAVYDRYELRSIEPGAPAAMTFALSNRCNLGCVMCNGELSSTLRRRAGLAPLPARYGDEFFEDLEPLLHQLQYAKFLGGEPFLVREHERVWQLMAGVGAPARLQVTTNATVWTDRVEWVLATFLTDVTVSLDAVGRDAYERIRVGADHGQVMANVERFLTRCRDRGTELRVCFCLMAENWDELPAMLRWADERRVPVSVNVVSDIGLALHDLPVDRLDAVARTWERVGDDFGTNADVWRTQVEQLDAVRAERVGGEAGTRRQAQVAPAVFFDVAPGQPSAEGALDIQVERLRQWSTEDDVAVLRVDEHGGILQVAAALHRLGLDESAVGTSSAELLARISDADGRPAWALGDEQVDGTTVRTVVLAGARPERGVAGSIVRTVTVSRPGGRWILVAEDRSYDRGTPVSVGAPKG